MRFGKCLANVAFRRGTTVDHSLGEWSPMPPLYARDNGGFCFSCLRVIQSRGGTIRAFMCSSSSTTAYDTIRTRRRVGRAELVGRILTRKAEKSTHFTIRAIHTLRLNRYAIFEQTSGEAVQTSVR